MKIPKYVVELMSRAEFDVLHPRGDPGYTLRICKATAYTRHETLCKEVERLVAWANKKCPVPDEYESPTASVISTPHSTRYKKQYAVVTIYDPVMRELEKYIPR